MTKVIERIFFSAANIRIRMQLSMHYLLLLEFSFTLELILELHVSQSFCLVS